LLQFTRLVFQLQLQFTRLVLGYLNSNQKSNAEVGEFEDAVIDADMFDLESSSVDPPKEYDVDSSMSGDLTGEMSPEMFVKKSKTQKWFNEVGASIIQY